MQTCIDFYLLIDPACQCARVRLTDKKSELLLSSW